MRFENKVVWITGASSGIVHSGGISQRAVAAETDLAVDRAIMETNVRSK